MEERSASEDVAWSEEIDHLPELASGKHVHHSQDESQHEGAPQYGLTMLFDKIQNTGLIAHMILSP
jgi:hypothetical protein